MVFSLVSIGAGSLLLLVTCKKLSKGEEEEAAPLKQGRDKSDRVVTAVAAGVAKRRHKALWTLPLESH